jgi:hypothetical protein
MKTENESTWIDVKSTMSRDILTPPWSESADGEKKLMFVSINKKFQPLPDHSLFGADLIPYIRRLIPVFSVFYGSPDGLA